MHFGEKWQFVDFIYAWLYMEYGYLYRRYTLCELYLCDSHNRINNWLYVHTEALFDIVYSSVSQSTFFEDGEKRASLFVIILPLNVFCLPM